MFLFFLQFFKLIIFHKTKLNSIGQAFENISTDLDMKVITFCCGRINQLCTVSVCEIIIICLLIWIEIFFFQFSVTFTKPFWQANFLLLGLQIMIILSIILTLDKVNDRYPSYFNKTNQPMHGQGKIF